MSWSRAARRNRGVTRWELALLGLILAVALAIRVVAVILHRHAPLVGDGPNYAAAGRLFVAGKIGWQIEPFGVPHPFAFKAPLYPTWVGINFALFGSSPERVELVQAIISLATVVFIWLTARRLFGKGVAIATAAVVAVYPFAWQHVTTLYPEAIAVPLYAAILWSVLAREPTVRRAAIVGIACGVAVLLRPGSIVLLGAVLLAWALSSNLRRGLGMSLLTIACTAVVVLPWTIRNAVVLHGFIPVSEEDSAIEGTFNSSSAHDTANPFAWRAYTPLALRLLAERPRPSEVEIRSERLNAAYQYIGHHPTSLLEAFFWNGLSRTWDIRRLSQVLADARSEGRGLTLARIGIFMYWVLLPLALAGLWRLRRHKRLLLPILTLAAGTSVLYTAVAATRYRAPLEPLIVMLAMYSAHAVLAPPIRSV